MKYIPLLFLLLFACTASAQQAPTPAQVAGSWQGALEISGTKLRLVFNITAAADGSLSATLDSPDQGAKGIPVQSVRLVQDSMFLQIPALQGAYAGKVTSPETINGTLTQRGMHISIPLTKGAAEVSKRPQDPQQPYPYQEQEVTVENNSAGITLAGTLTLPKESGAHPAVILFTGSGPQDRDMTVMGHRPYLVLADHLTRQGFAVLRLDDRGMGKSGGNATTATTQDFASDAQAAYTYLKSRKEVNPKKIGLLGLSEGALIAAKVAAQQSDVAFVVLLAGNAVSGTELLVAQNEAIFKTMGTPPETLQKLLNLRRAQFEVAASTPDVQVAAQKIAQLEQETRKQLNPQEQQQLGLSPETEKMLIAQLSSAWLRYFLAYNPAPTLQKLKMPVLALNGSKDLQVPASQNLPATEKALKAGGNKKYTVEELPGLNHLFQTANTGLHTEYGQLEETMAPLAMKKISDWIKTVVK